MKKSEPYQNVVVLPGEGDDAAVHRGLLIGLFDADVNHLWEVTVGLQLLETKSFSSICW